MPMHAQVQRKNNVISEAKRAQNAKEEIVILLVYILDLYKTRTGLFSTMVMSDNTGSWIQKSWAPLYALLCQMIMGFFRDGQENLFLSPAPPPPAWWKTLTFPSLLVGITRFQMAPHHGGKSKQAHPDLWAFRSILESAPETLTHESRVYTSQQKTHFFVTWTRVLRLKFPSLPGTNPMNCIFNKGISEM